jgi:hypothetical protein
VPFRRVQQQENEIELLITVTPQLVEALDPCEVPPCGPGMMTQAPNDCELYGRAYIEVPGCCPGEIGPGGYPAGPGPGYHMPEEHVGPPSDDLPPADAPPMPLPAPTTRRSQRPGTTRLPPEQAASAATAGNERARPRPDSASAGSAPGPDKRPKPVELRVRPTTTDSAPEPGFIGAMGYDTDR